MAQTNKIEHVYHDRMPRAKTQKPKKSFIPMTKAQKIEYAKQFKPETVQAYRKGKRNGFLDGVHAPKRIKGAK